MLYPAELRGLTANSVYLIAPVNRFRKGSGHVRIDALSSVRPRLEELCRGGSGKAGYSAVDDDIGAVGRQFGDGEAHVVAVLQKKQRA